MDSQGRLKKTGPPVAARRRKEKKLYKDKAKPVVRRGRKATDPPLKKRGGTAGPPNTLSG